MGAALVLGLVSLVVVFIIGILSAFPIDTASAETVIPPANFQNTQDFDPDAIEEAGERFFFGYKSIIKDLVSFQRNPSLERAEARRDALISYAGNVKRSFTGLSDELRERLDQLTTSGEEDSE